MKNIFLLSIAIFSQTLMCFAQAPKIVYWLHGFGGNKSTWGQAADATDFYFSQASTLNNYQPYKVYSRKLEYTMANSVESGANDILTNLPVIENADRNSPIFGNADFSKGFVICHSLGGIVARKVDQKYDIGGVNSVNRQIHGIVTFTTPHAGTQLLAEENIRPTTGNIPKYIESACHDLLLGPATDAIYNLTGFVGFLANQLVSPEKIEQGVNFICKLSTSSLETFFLPYNQPIANDLKPNSPIILGLNNVTSQLPKVAFYGVEDQGSELWRIVSSSLTTKPTSTDYFVDPTKDDDLKIAADNGLIYYFNHYIYWRDQITKANSAFGGALAINAFKMLARRDAYFKGYVWWQSANDNYLRIIGGLVPKITVTPGFDCNCTEFDYDEFPINTWTTTVTDENDCYNRNSTFVTCSPVPTTIYDYSEEHINNDGLVTMPSALAFPGLDIPNDPGLPNRAPMLRSNHSQLTNDFNTRDRLNELFLGQYGLFFRTLNK